MSDDYIADLREMVEDMEEYEEKLDQFYEGLQMLGDKPEKAQKLMRDAYKYFEEFSEKHVDEDRKFDSFKETRERLKNYFKNHGIDHRFMDLSKRSWSSRRSRKNSKRDRDRGSTLKTYSFDPDGEMLEVDDILDLAYTAASGDFSDVSSSETANASDQDAFNDFVDNWDFNYKKLKQETETLSEL